MSCPSAPCCASQDLLGSLLIALIAGAAFMNEWSRFALYFLAPTGGTQAQIQSLARQLASISSLCPLCSSLSDGFWSLHFCAARLPACSCS